MPTFNFVWAVRFYEEIESLWTTREAAEARAGELGDEWSVDRWEVLTGTGRGGGRIHGVVVPPIEKAVEERVPE
jgi:hypothetical protein